MGATAFFWACLAVDIIEAREMNQLKPYCPGIFQCQFQFLELMVERILQSTHLGTETSQDQKSQVNNYELQNVFVVFSQWS